jgi:hypothetical protein
MLYQLSYLGEVPGRAWRRGAGPYRGSLPPCPEARPANSARKGRHRDYSARGKPALRNAALGKATLRTGPHEKEGPLEKPRWDSALGIVSLEQPPRISALPAGIGKMPPRCGPGHRRPPHRAAQKESGRAGLRQPSSAPLSSGRPSSSSSSLAGTA